MANSIKILELLKWYTDEEHPITQEKLRKIPGANQYMGYKTTFKRRLFNIADILNADATNEKDWRLVFPGYSCKTKDPDDQRHYIGHIYYQHEIHTHELDFIMDQILLTNLFAPEEKKNLSERLVRLLGNIYYEHSAYRNMHQMLSIPTYNTTNLIDNLAFLRDAIDNKKMVEFQTTYLNQYGGYQQKPNSTRIVSPYRIIFYQGFYWLLGNERIGPYKAYNGLKHIRYSPTYDIFRIDKITNIKIAKDSLEKKSKYYGNTHQLLQKLEKILLYRENEQINYKDITDDYGRVEFVIDWERFPENQKGDYSFIKDTFGSNYQIFQRGEATIVSVQSTENFFIDWALRYVDKIQILGTTDFTNLLKSQIKTILQTGLNKLD